MKIKSEFFQIAKSATDDAGQRLEPEEQPALIVQNIAGGAEATVDKGARTVGSVPLQVARATTAGELAHQRSRQCHNCKHWRNGAWVKLIGDAAQGIGAPEELHGVDLMRSAIIEQFFSDAEDDLDPAEVDRMLASMGVCGPLTEHERATDPNMGPKELVVTFPTSCCPMAIVTPTQPDGFFVARDREAGKFAGQDRDAVLLAAAWKAPK